jgi:hypothetical protein
MGRDAGVQLMISGAIMHGAFNSERGRAMPGILDAIGRDNIREYLSGFAVIEDWMKEGSWATAKRAWTFGIEQRSTHHFVLQDDVIICRDFLLGLYELIKVKPDEIICLMPFSRKPFKGNNGKNRWGVAEGVWGQGILMPTPMVADFLVWEQKHIRPDFKHDDSRISLYCVQNNRKVWIPFPTLLDHADLEMKSLMGHKWKEPRVSPDFLEDRSPLDFSWEETEPPLKSINSYTYFNKWLIK